MKIFKLAAGGTVPPGFVEIELTLNPDGTGERKITATGAGAGCNDANHVKLMNDIMGTAVDGFYGPLVDVDTQGLTPEGLAAKRSKQKAAPIADAPFKSTPKIKAPGQGERKKMDTGFGV